MTFLTWNVQRAGTERTRRQAAWLCARAPDVLILTEVGPAAAIVLPDRLGRAGYHLVGIDNSASGAGVVLAARRGRLVRVPGALPTMAHRCETAVLRLEWLSVAVTGLYVPSRGGPEGRNVAKRNFQHAVTALLPRLRGHFGLDSGPMVIAGDLNVIEPGHEPPHRIYGRWEYDFYRAFAAHGFVDAYRQAHPDAVDHSWFGRRSGAGYRFDHLFCSAFAGSAVGAAAYLHEPRVTGLSDHSAMTVRLDCGPRAFPAG